MSHNVFLNSCDSTGSVLPLNTNLSSFSLLPLVCIFPALLPTLPRAVTGVHTFHANPQLTPTTRGTEPSLCCAAPAGPGSAAVPPLAAVNRLLLLRNSRGAAAVVRNLRAPHHHHHHHLHHRPLLTTTICTTSSGTEFPSRPRGHKTRVPGAAGSFLRRDSPPPKSTRCTPQSALSAHVTPDLWAAA